MGAELSGQRHFRPPYKHEAQASEQVTSKPTRSRVVLVFMAKQGEVALSNYGRQNYGKQKYGGKDYSAAEPPPSGVVGGEWQVASGE